MHGLHVDANLGRRPAWLWYLRLRQADIFKRLAARQPDLQLNQVHPGNGFRNGMFDLQARIGLDEVVLGPLDEEFESPKVPVVRGSRERNRRSDHALAHRPREAGRGRNLDELLVLSLQRAVPIPELRHLSIAVSSDLNFHMPDALQKAFYEHILHPERGERFRARSLVGCLEILRP